MVWSCHSPQNQNEARGILTWCSQSRTSPGGVPQLLSPHPSGHSLGLVSLLSLLNSMQASHATSSSRKPSLILHPTAPHLALSS